MIRNTEINSTSPLDDIKSALTGVWAVSIENDWNKVVIGSRLTIWRRILKPGKQMLPKKFDRVNVLKLYNDDGTTECRIIRLGAEAINISKESFGEIMEIALPENNKE